VIPITPIQKTMTIIMDKRHKSVTRRQLPLMAAYAFTDYWSQGQTLPAVIVDTAMSPTGGLTLSNAYMCSCQEVQD
jgi:ATP-dependent exoDNAse (exonuclease V) alpha subunit